MRLDDFYLVEPLGANGQTEPSCQIPWRAIHNFFHRWSAKTGQQATEVKKKLSEPSSSPLVGANSGIESYCFGAAGFGAAVEGCGRAAPGAAAEGAAGTGAATPDEVLYAVTTACVTSVL